MNAQLPDRASNSIRCSLNQADDSRNYKYVKLKLNREQRYADLTVHGPEGRSANNAGRDSETR